MLTLWLGLTCTPCVATPDLPQLAIIIDDVGYNYGNGLGFAKLPADITLAVLPQAPYSQTLAQRGWLNGKEIILHIPMSSRAGDKLDPGGISIDMQAPAIEDLLSRHFRNFPNASGLNNHMGSQLTTMVAPMLAVMTFLKHRQLYFIDSRTHADSVAQTTAEKIGVANAKRDIFLDNERSSAAIRKQLYKAVATAQKQGQAIAIGHPYSATLAVIKEELPRLTEQVRLVHSYRLSSHHHQTTHNKVPISQISTNLKTPWVQRSLD